MGRIFTVKGGQSQVASATETHVQVIADATRGFRIRRLRVTQVTHKVSEQHTVYIQEASAEGSGGTTPTAVPRDGISVFQGTTRINQTAEPTYTSQPIHLERAFNTLIGVNEVFDRDEAPYVEGGKRLAVKIISPSGTTTMTPSVEVDLEED